MYYPDTKLAPRAYQVEALNAALPHRGYFLAHDMGTGKTKTAIDICTARGAERILVVCPKAVVSTWPAEFEKNAPVMPTVLCLNKGAIKARAKLLTRALELGGPIVAVINYEAMWRPPFGPTYKQNRMVDIGLLRKVRWDEVIFDESHRIKSPGGKASMFAKHFRKQECQILALTGTPMPHSPLDIYAQARAVEPELFGTSFVKFRSRFAIMGGFEGRQVVDYRDLDILHDTFYSRAHRVCKGDVLDLPPTTHVTLTCDLPIKALKIYKELENEMIAEVGSGIVTAANALVKLLRLQQVASGYVKDEDGKYHQVHDEKAELLSDLLQDIPADEPVVVFVVFRSDIDAIKKVCESKAVSRTYSELSGECDDHEAWKAGKTSVLIAQIQAGAEGVNLVRACYNIYYGVGTSLGRYLQSLARSDRSGQTRPVTYYHLVANGTVDVQVRKALEQKRDIVETVIDRMRDI
jgi:SNF2 family DNA or RNA helicase